MLRILVADDHEIIRQSVRGLLARRAEWQICGEAPNGREAVEMVKRLRPDIVILDLGMSELNGLEATAQIRKALPKTEVLAFTMHDAEDMVRHVIGAGARAYVLKSESLGHLECAVEAAANHMPYFSPSISKIMLDAIAAAGRAGADLTVRREPLTKREREIVQLLAEGRSNKEISGLLDLTVATVQTHRATIMRKLAVRSIAELVRYAVRNRIIEA